MLLLNALPKISSFANMLELLYVQWHSREQTVPYGYMLGQNRHSVELLQGNKASPKSHGATFLNRHHSTTHPLSRKFELESNWSKATTKDYFSKRVVASSKRHQRLKSNKYFGLKKKDFLQDGRNNFIILG